MVKARRLQIYLPPSLFEWFDRHAAGRKMTASALGASLISFYQGVIEEATTDSRIRHQETEE